MGDVILYPLQEEPFEPLPPFRFTSLDGKVIKVASATFNEYGGISSITDIEGTSFEEGQFRYERELLLIEGFGQIPEGAYLKYRGETYLLCFGWHTNGSNQVIYSWYLQSLKDDQDKMKDPYSQKTVYRWMIDEIDLVSFR